MTQEEALARFQEMRPERKDKLAASLDHRVGYITGFENTFILWDYSASFDAPLHFASSFESWEDVLQKAKERSNAA